MAKAATPTDASDLKGANSLIPTTFPNGDRARIDDVVQTPALFKPGAQNVRDDDR